MTKDEINQILEKIYNFMMEYSDDNGYPPSIREICNKFKIKSTASAYSYIEKLKEKGLISKNPQKKRTLSIEKSCGFKRIPLIGVVKAGQPIFAVENLEGYYPLPSDFNSGNDQFALRISGNSMINTGINNKDVIIVDKCNSAKNGDIVVALIEDSATVKRFYKKNGKIILHPENDEMSDMIFDDVLILGIVKGLYRKF